MATTRVKISIVCLLAPLASTSAWPVVAQNSANEFWPQIKVFVNLSQDSRVYFQYSGIRTNELSQLAEGQVAAYFNYFAGSLIPRQPPQFLLLREGYYHSKQAQTSGPPSIENTAVLIADLRIPSRGGLFWIERNRGDLRFINGQFQPRYRNRLRLERPIKAGSVTLTPRIDAEIFYDTQYDTISTYRYTAGSFARFNGRVTVEAYYALEINKRSSPRLVNALGLTLYLYIR